MKQLSKLPLPPWIGCQSTTGSLPAVCCLQPFTTWTPAVERDKYRGWFAMEWNNSLTHWLVSNVQFSSITSFKKQAKNPVDSTNLLHALQPSLTRDLKLRSMNINELCTDVQKPGLLDSKPSMRFSCLVKAKGYFTYLLLDFLQCLFAQGGFVVLVILFILNLTCWLFVDVGSVWKRRILSTSYGETREWNGFVWIYRQTTSIRWTSM